MSDRFTLGYTSGCTAMLDLDNITKSQARRHAQKLMSRFNLKGYLLLQSSEYSHHVVFDRKLDWRTALRVMFACPPCRKRYKRHFSWAEMQAIKGYATLRIGNKDRKHPPKIIEFVGSRRDRIAAYLQMYSQFSRR